VQNELKETL